MAASRSAVAIVFLGCAALLPTQSEAGAEVRLSKDFLDGIVTKLPPCQFDKEDHYRGSVNSFRLRAIDPRRRMFLVDCQIEGEFRPPVAGLISERAGRSSDTPEGWRRFRFDIKAKVNLEPGPRGSPHLRIEIDEVKRREIDGLSGVVAKLLGQYFDELVTQIVSGRASKLNRKLNDEIMKRITVFKEYGVLCGVDYSQTGVVLHFDVTRFRLEGITGYVFADARPETVPVQRWLHPRDGSHYYTVIPNAPDRPNSVSDGICFHAFDHLVPDASPIYRWHAPHDELYTVSLDGEGSRRAGFRPQGIAFYVYKDPKPGTIPLYRFYDPARHQHFCTTHPHAEFAK